MKPVLATWSSDSQKMNPETPALLCAHTHTGPGDNESIENNSNHGNIILVKEVAVRLFRLCN